MHNKLILTVTTVYTFSVSSIAQITATSNAYKFSIDLVNVKDDKVKVELLVPVIKENVIRNKTI